MSGGGLPLRIGTPKGASLPAVRVGARPVPSSFAAASRQSSLGALLQARAGAEKG